MSDDTQLGPGAELKATREEMKVSTREVADALNLPAHVIEALEADDFDRLPPTVFTRGYLRSYARLLELSPDALLARYPEVTEEVDIVTGESAIVGPTSQIPKSSIGIGVGAVVVIVLLLAWYFSSDGSDEPVEGALPVEETPAEGRGTEPPSAVELEIEPGSGTGSAEPGGRVSATAPGQGADGPTVEPVARDADREAQEAASGADEPGSEAQESESETGPALTIAATEATTRSRPSVTADAQPSPGVIEGQTSSASSGKRERRITEFGDDVLTLSFAEDCWVEVKSVSGENLYSDLNRAGWTLVLTGRAPFRLLLGYAPGVTVSFNDEAVPLARHSRNNVANLVLGE